MITSVKELRKMIIQDALKINDRFYIKKSKLTLRLQDFLIDMIKDGLLEKDNSSRIAHCWIVTKKGREYANPPSVSEQEAQH